MGSEPFRKPQRKAFMGSDGRQSGRGLPDKRVPGRHHGHGRLPAECLGMETAQMRLVLALHAFKVYQRPFRQRQRQFSGAEGGDDRLLARDMTLAVGGRDAEPSPARFLQPASPDSSGFKPPPKGKASSQL